MKEDKIVFRNFISAFLKRSNLVDKYLLEDKSCWYLGDRLFDNVDEGGYSNDLDMATVLDLLELSCKEVIESCFVDYIKLKSSDDADRFVIEHNRTIKNEFGQDFIDMVDKLTKEILSRDYVQEYICSLLTDFDFDYRSQFYLEKLKRFMESIDVVE